MRQLTHPALTLFMGVCLESPHLCIVTEIVDRGMRAYVDSNFTHNAILCIYVYLIQSVHSNFTHMVVIF